MQYEFSSFETFLGVYKYNIYKDIKNIIVTIKKVNVDLEYLGYAFFQMNTLILLTH